MPLPIRVLPLCREDRARLESLVRSRTTPQRVVERARIVLGSAAGDSGSTIGGDVGVSRPTVTLWLDRYEAGGLAAPPGRSSAVGTPETYYPGRGRSHRTPHDTNDAARGPRHPLEYAADGRGDRFPSLHDCAHLEGPWAAPPPGPVVQVVHRPRLRGKTPGCRRVVPAAARAGYRLLV